MPTPDIYIAPQVAAVKALHQHTIDSRNQCSSVWAYLQQMAQNLASAYQEQKTAAITEINNYHPAYLGKPETEIRKNDLQQADFQRAIAREYGYENWAQVTQEGQTLINLEFELALDLLLSGQRAALAAMLDENPSLIQATSSFGHKAQLIHYVGSNGVEMWRQVVPLNLAEITQLLLAHGANPLAEVNVYGGSKVAELVSSSGHPWDAGVAEEVLALF